MSYGQVDKKQAEYCIGLKDQQAAAVTASSQMRMFEGSWVQAFKEDQSMEQDGFLQSRHMYLDLYTSYIHTVYMDLGFTMGLFPAACINT